VYNREVVARRDGWRTLVEGVVGRDELGG